MQLASATIVLQVGVLATRTLMLQLQIKPLTVGEDAQVYHSLGGLGIGAGAAALV